MTLDHARQAGAKGIVTALHHIPAGEAWPLEEVLARRAAIEAAGLVWSVVESIPVHDTIKTRRGAVDRMIGAYKDSIRACAQAGVQTICYNFMPVVDWTRTDLRYLLPTTGYALRFDMAEFVEQWRRVRPQG